MARAAVDLAALKAALKEIDHEAPDGEPRRASELAAAMLPSENEEDGGEQEAEHEWRPKMFAVLNLRVTVLRRQVIFFIKVNIIFG